MCFKLSLKQGDLSQEELDLVIDSNFGGDLGDQNFIDGIQDDLSNHFLEAFNTIDTFMNNLEPGTLFANLQQITQALILLFPSMEPYQDETDGSESLIIDDAEVYSEEDIVAEDEAQEDVQDVEEVKEEGQEACEEASSYIFCREVLEDDDHEKLTEVQCSFTEDLHLCLEDGSDVESEQSQRDLILISPGQEVQKK